MLEENSTAPKPTPPSPSSALASETPFPIASSRPSRRRKTAYPAHKFGNLFHGNISSVAIDQALEKLSSLGAATSRFGAAQGRPTTLWSAVDHEYAERMEEESPPENSF